MEDYTNRVERYLEAFESAIEATQTFFDRLEVLGRYSARSPYRLKCELKHLLFYLECNGIEVSGYRKRYLLICDTLKKVEDLLGEPLREKLMAELQFEIDQYGRIVRFFLHPSFLDEVDNDLDHRTSIEILRAELRRDHDLREIDIKVAALDRVMRFKYERGIDTLSDKEIRRLESRDISLPPDPFWWVHPSLVLAQRGPGPIDTVFLHFARHGPDFGLSGELSDHEGAQNYFAQAAHLASLREGVEVYYQTDLKNLVIYDRPSNTFAAGNENGEIQSSFRPEATGVSGIYRPYVDERDARGLLIPLKGKAERAVTTDTPADLVRQALERYAAVIHETEAHLDALTVKGRYTARAPYCCKYLLGYLLAFHEAQGVVLASARTEYERLNRQLAALEGRGGSAFREQVFVELQFFVENYWRVVASATTLEPYSTEAENDLNERDALAILLLELERDHDLTEMRIQVDVLDEQHRSMYRDYGFRDAGIYAAIAADYYPEEFWWRHPKK